MGQAGMEYQEFASDLRGPTIVSSSIEEDEEIMRVFDVDQNMRQLGKGQFRSHLAVRTVGDTELFADRFNTALSLHVEAPKGTTGVLFPRSVSGRFLASGENLREDKLIVLPPGTGTDIVIPAMAGSEDFAIPPDRFTKLMHILCPTMEMPDHATIYEGDVAKLQAIRERIVDLVAAPETEISKEEVSALVDCTIAWLGESAPYWGPESMTIDPERVRIAKKAQEYIEEHYDDCIHMEDLCGESIVGVRTLQRCFKEYFDVTVSEYLKTKRLDAAHRDLSDAHLKMNTVTEIALNHGFSHLGRFSVDFKERFGESPGLILAAKESQKSVVREIPASVFLATANMLATTRGD